MSVCWLRFNSSGIVQHWSYLSGRASPGLKGEYMESASYRPSRRSFLQAATAGVLASAIAAPGAAAADSGLAAAGLPAGFSIVDAHIRLWVLSRNPVPWTVGNAI